jgi:hypothetical protein
MRHRALLAGLGAALLFSCTPTGMCACPPSRTHAVVYGSVHSAAGEPVAGAQVAATVFSSVCGQGRDELDPGASPVSSDAAGNFRMRFHTYLLPQTACVQVTARTAGATDSAVAYVAISLRDSNSAPDSSRVDLVLP